MNSPAAITRTEYKPAADRARAEKRTRKTWTARHPGLLLLTLIGPPTLAIAGAAAIVTSKATLPPDRTLGVFEDTQGRSASFRQAYALERIAAALESIVARMPQPPAKPTSPEIDGG